MAERRQRCQDGEKRCPAVLLLRILWQLRDHQDFHLYLLDENTLWAGHQREDLQGVGQGPLEDLGFRLHVLDPDCHFWNDSQKHHHRLDYLDRLAHLCEAVPKDSRGPLRHILYQLDICNSPRQHESAEYKAPDTQRPVHRVVHWFLKRLVWQDRFDHSILPNHNDNLNPDRLCGQIGHSED
jgi:hypothetical protein